MPLPSNNFSYSIQHSFDEEKNILIRTVTGTIDMDGVIKTWNDDIAAGLVTPELKTVVTDFTQGENVATYKQKSEIIKFYKKNSHIFSHFKMAVVIDVPTGVAITMRVEKEQPDLLHRTFSTLEGALEWARL